MSVGLFRHAIWFKKSEQIAATLQQCKCLKLVSVGRSVGLCQITNVISDGPCSFRILRVCANVWSLKRWQKAGGWAHALSRMFTWVGKGKTCGRRNTIKTHTNSIKTARKKAARNSKYCVSIRFQTEMRRKMHPIEQLALQLENNQNWFHLTEWSGSRKRKYITREAIIPANYHDRIYMCFWAVVTCCEYTPCRRSEPKTYSDFLLL